MKTLSRILLVLNPICGFFMVSSMITSGISHDYYWLLFVPLLICAVVLNMKFYFHVFKEEHEVYEKWRVNFSKTHEYLGLEPFYEYEHWRNKITGEITYH